jgi:hypothetical protein
MSNQDSRNDGSLVLTGERDLAPIGYANPLILRGIADLARMQNAASLGETSRHPFDIRPSLAAWRAQRNLLGLQLRLRQQSVTGPKLDQVQPHAVKPPENLAGLPETHEELDEDE